MPVNVTKGLNPYFYLLEEIEELSKLIHFL